MTKPMPDLGFAFNLKPEAAIRYFQTLGYDTPENWQELAQQTHAQARTIAGIYKQDITAEFYRSLHAAMEQGIPFAAWKKDITQRLQQSGYQLDKMGDIVDTTTGEVLGTGLNKHRLQTIYHTNMANANAAGEWQALQANKANRPYLQYNAVMDRRTRPAHSALDGVVYPIDDEFWHYFYPPNGFRCRCKVMALSERDVAREGVTVQTSNPEQFDTVEVSLKTGKNYTVTTYTTPLGVKFRPDRGFDTNVGMSHLAQLGQLHMQRAIDLPPHLASMAVGQALKQPELMNALTQQFQQRFDYLKNQYGSNQILHVGVLSIPVLDALSQRGIMPQSAIISMGDADMTHALREGKKQRGQALPDDVIRNIPNLLLNPDAVYLQKDKDNPVLWFVYETEQGKFVLLIDKTDKKSKEKINILRTGGKIRDWKEALSLQELIWGKDLLN